MLLPKKYFKLLIEKLIGFTKKKKKDFPSSSAGKESTSNAGYPSLIPGWGRSTGEVFLGFPGGLVSKESACNVGHLGSIPGLGRSPGEGNGYPLQYSGLENSMDYPWGCKESDTIEWLSLYQKIGGHHSFPGGKNQPAMREMWVRSMGQDDLLEKKMATYSSILPWDIPQTEEPGGLQSLGLQKSQTWLSN